MLDKSVPFYPVIMLKDNPNDYPKYELPSGYSFCMYEEGFEDYWAEVETAAGEFDEVSAGKEHFITHFMPHKEVLQKRCIFVKNSDGKIIATTSAWRSNLLGIEDMPRIHWVAVHPEHWGKGIAKAMVTKSLDIYKAANNTKSVFLVTQTWSYPAINIYLKFGFKPYTGSKPKDWEHKTDDFDRDNDKAWGIIFGKIGSSNAC